MCCKRVYDAPVEMDDTSQIIKISLASPQKQLSSKMDRRIDSTSGAAAVPPQHTGLDVTFEVDYFVCFLKRYSKIK